jgi:hypothetical protein
MFILVCFVRACAPVRCAHPSFLAHCHAKRGAARPPVRRSFAASYSTPKNILNLLSNLGRPREGLFSFNSTTEAREYTECQAFYPVVRIGSPHPLTCKRVLFPPLWIQGGRHTHFRRGWGESIPTMGHTLWYSMYTCSTV